MPERLDDTYGLDVSTFVDGDLDPFFRPIAGPRVVAEAIVRRWTTPTGALFYDPAFGIDVRELLSRALSPHALFALRAQLAAQAEEDERVLEAHVEVELAAATRRLVIRARIRIAEGPFALVVAIDDLSLSLLEPT
ncbi:MAG: hypothetical protein HYV09_24785 [Deltaproteobacteria bacterium]|nr:hypothetical protein [Deltaproteobacteria bacterium]